jgi:hypothetical protein
VNQQINVFSVPVMMFQHLGDLYPSGEYHLDNPAVRVFRFKPELTNITITYFEEDV